MLFALGRASNSKLPPSTLYKTVQRSPHDSSLLTGLITDTSITMSGGISSVIYQTLFRRNAVFLSSIFVGAFAFEIAFDTASNKVWDCLNKGRQWKDIRHKYIQAAQEDDDE
ncbi:hypothetical protein DTO164E3_5622 [Paecilomyces variotii]|nr:hypothetical protein DTO164E3_5622 [Paecilomyces variotii]KAJ9198238.1 hypothetical protein DTO032I3_5654 [Paecilomyces variotii]KAJ9274872.1 hypothetical protein DTO021D3_8230 [Paecilomyces variotii]KAJ9344688.1 hypothetical protein DTO027B6_2870 [Paecilomyces variotii]KAJ9347658.1 hypothetical protein DTO027B9_8990 [Paecilomyces variotii]